MTRLTPLDEATYATWRAETVRDYAAEKVANGTWRETEALARSERAFNELLPLGLASPDQELRAMIDDAGTTVGVVWFAIEERPFGQALFIYDIVVFPEHRRRGHANAALTAVEAYAREHDCVAVQLRVSGPNADARQLYQKAGYVETDVTMLKKV